ncbi:hypothetical protein [Chitiniphilus shinanonensis]|uniref:hypothetical protein n=1 Tax=Chitiniphilus shinanonensis TaxID=553088 RepID=UPI00333E7C2B
MRLPKFWILATAQVVLTTLGAVIWFYFSTKAYLAGPPDPDSYAWNWHFQWMAFALVWLPGILLITGLILAIEYKWLVPRFYPDAVTPKKRA